MEREQRIYPDLYGTLYTLSLQRLILLRRVENGVFRKDYTTTARRLNGKCPAR